MEKEFETDAEQIAMLKVQLAMYKEFARIVVACIGPHTILRSIRERKGCSGDDCDCEGSVQ